MLVVALTGGIGSGKSAVAERFSALGVPVLDADQLARELVAPGLPALAEIREAFGPQALGPDGALDRLWLRERIFTEPQARQRLEGILHPRIRSEMLRRLETLRVFAPPYVVVVIPLLLETHQTDLADRILVVDAPEAIQIERVMARDRQTHAQARAILSSQWDRPRRLAAATECIDNSGSRDALLAQVDAFHRYYLELASDR